MTDIEGDGDGLKALSMILWLGSGNCIEKLLWLCGIVVPSS